MTTIFRPIRPKKISEEIVNQIKELIVKGDLKPGDRIPSERELAASLDVSRPSVREALMGLEALGFLESRQGGGTYVRSLADPAMADPLTNLIGDKAPQMLYALVEVRMGLETWSAYLAAKRATDEQIARLKELYAIMEKQAATGGWDAEIDAQFHIAITEATHNTLQVHVLNTIYSLFHTTIMVALSEFYSREGYVDTLLAQHKAIIDAIADHDPEKARQKMEEHLGTVEKKMAQIMEKGGF